MKPLIDRKNNQRYPQPDEISMAMATKLTAADFVAMPGIVRRAIEMGWITEPDETGTPRPLHRRKEA